MVGGMAGGNMRHPRLQAYSTGGCVVRSVPGLRQRRRLAGSRAPRTPTAAVVGAPGHEVTLPARGNVVVTPSKQGRRRLKAADAPPSGDLLPIIPKPSVEETKAAEGAASPSEEAGPEAAFSQAVGTAGAAAAAGEETDEEEAEATEAQGESAGLWRDGGNAWLPPPLPEGFPTELSVQCKSPPGDPSSPVKTGTMLLGRPVPKGENNRAMRGGDDKPAESCMVACTCAECSAAAGAGERTAGRSWGPAEGGGRLWRVTAWVKLHCGQVRNRNWQQAVQVTDGAGTGTQSFKTFLERRGLRVERQRESRAKDDSSAPSNPAAPLLPGACTELVAKLWQAHFEYLGGIRQRPPGVAEAVDLVLARSRQAPSLAPSAADPASPSTSLTEPASRSAPSTVVTASSSARSSPAPAAGPAWRPLEPRHSSSPALALFGAAARGEGEELRPGSVVVLRPSAQAPDLGPTPWYKHSQHPPVVAEGEAALVMAIYGAAPEGGEGAEQELWVQLRRLVPGDATLLGDAADPAELFILDTALPPSRQEGEGEMGVQGMSVRGGAKVTGLAISNRHPYMFSCGLDKMVKCWDLEQNKEAAYRCLPEHTLLAARLNPQQPQPQAQTPGGSRAKAKPKPKAKPKDRAKDSARQVPLAPCGAPVVCAEVVGLLPAEPLTTGAADHTAKHQADLQRSKDNVQRYEQRMPPRLFYRSVYAPRQAAFRTPLPEELPTGVPTGVPVPPPGRRPPGPAWRMLPGGGAGEGLELDGLEYRVGDLLWLAPKPAPRPSASASLPGGKSAGGVWARARLLAVLPPSSADAEGAGPEGGAEEAEEAPAVKGRGRRKQELPYAGPTLRVQPLPAPVFGAEEAAESEAGALEEEEEEEEVPVTRVAGRCQRPGEAEAPSPPPLAAMDVFAGVGGLTEGLHQRDCTHVLLAAMTRAGAQASCVASPEAEKGAREIPPELAARLPAPGEVELLAGGPPCPGFSNMNAARGNSPDAMRKNAMVPAYLSYLDFYRPRFCLLENVIGFLQPFGAGKEAPGSEAEGSEAEPEDADGSAPESARIGALSAVHYGVPQRRQRAFVWAAAPGEALPDWPAPRTAAPVPPITLHLPGGRYVASAHPGRCHGAPAPMVTIRDAIADLPPLRGGSDRGALEMPYTMPPHSAFAAAKRQPRLPAAPASGPGGPGSVLAHGPQEAAGTGAQDEAGAAAGPGAGPLLRDHVLMPPMELPWKGEPPAGLEGITPEERERRMLAAICTGQDWTSLLGTPEAALLHPAWAARQAKKWYYLQYVCGRRPYDGYLPTATTGGQAEARGSRGWVHPDAEGGQHRMLSVRERARSQGFPDAHVFSGPPDARIRQVGNAVPPPLAAALGEQLRRAAAGGAKQAAGKQPHPDQRPPTASDPLAASE
ncbi:hypothetical protein HYH03_006419 [Edaphochlamys debaryana]|uniref:DNA (cytosine-5-)-methyltransferase n=1 Tax=Edaphochlamys debaryana TaxID=47281 RepID=A0A836C1F6_9CHLO|nr:hypothetical protein HYH03_006419 [Edaphochlamys debaryana]|eukprot:KAG2495474.1 hypothetical protein HYH03_006419 [Edaphochlamys debaryana]